MTAIEALNEELERLHKTLRLNCELFARKPAMIPIDSIQREIHQLTLELLVLARQEVKK